MTLLSIDTSFVTGSIAIIKDQKVLAHARWEKAKSHSEVISLHLEDLLAQSKINLEQLDAIVCGIGPGSFTGIRVGLSMAKGLAYSLNCPLIPVEDGFALALLSKNNDHSVISLIDAQKNKIFCSLYKSVNNKWETQISPLLISPSELDNYLDKEHYYSVGNALKNLKPLFNQQLLDKFIQTDIEFPDAVQTGIYVEKYHDQFISSDWQQALPLYLRKSSAEEILESKNT